MFEQACNEQHAATGMDTSVVPKRHQGVTDPDTLTTYGLLYQQTDTLFRASSSRSCCFCWRICESIRCVSLSCCFTADAIVTDSQMMTPQLVCRSGRNDQFTKEMKPKTRCLYKLTYVFPTLVRRW